MTKHIFITILCLTLFFESFSQKTLQKTWDAGAIHALEIDASGVYSVSITSEMNAAIVLYATVEGETFENVLISASEAKGILFLSLGYTPYFTAENDKLAAHKVMAVEMKLVIPEGMKVSVRSDIGSVMATGRFSAFNALLENGNCTLKDFHGNADLYSGPGAILVHARGNVSGSATSKRGAIQNELPEKGEYHISAKTNEGPITLLQTE